ncbi:hypothetical protein [Halolamina pelagica]|uniref:hypothetical protein n=1 Tax=Halolamina pelagica TaxID=699431 RepID=UPI00118773B3|nr:hypothetical protein [Halolamina pelagica]
MNDNRHTDGSGTEPIKNARSSKESVEDGWKSELVDGGVDEARAEDIVSMLQSSTELVLGSPSEDEVDEALRTAIEETDLEQYGAEQPRRLTSALLRVLDEWQDGTRAPPVAAAPRTAPTAWDDRTNGEPQRTGGTAHATGADETTHEDGAAETPDDPDAEESVTTVQGDPISPDPDLEPQADPGQEGIAGEQGRSTTSKASSKTQWTLRGTPGHRLRRLMTPVQPRTLRQRRRRNPKVRLTSLAGRELTTRRRPTATSR